MRILRRARFGIALFASCTQPTRLAAQSVPPADAVVGTWGARVTYPPSLAGELIVQQEGAQWMATIGSVRAPVARAGDSVTFQFGGDLGQFRGRVARGGREIRGFWIQPRTMVLGEAFASPLLLRQAHDGAWIGQVHPLEDSYSLYLVIRRDSAGAVFGVFRNPELNDFGRFSRVRVAQRLDSVVFTAGPDTLHPMLRLAASIEHVDSATAADRGGVGNAGWRLALVAPSLGRVVTLEPMTESQAIGLYARLPRAMTYRYAPPLDRGDGWQTSRAGAVGLDESRLSALVQHLIDTSSIAPRAPLVHSILVARHGRLVLEEYFFGFGPDQPHDIRSAGKTFASVLLGTAIQQGFPVSPVTPIVPYFRNEAPFAQPDPRKARITVGQLLTHSTGFACDDNADDAPVTENLMQAQQGQPNWWKFVLDAPMSHDPGAHYAYCSGSMNLMSGVLSRATSTWLPAYFDASLARPLQFGSYYFNLMPTLDGYLGGGTFLRPRDLAKVGQLYLARGMWNGRRLVPAAWVTTSTSKQIEWPYQNQNVSAGSDGYAWHLNTIAVNGRSYREYEANGNGGQLLMIVPEADLVVVFTGGNYGGGGVWNRWRDVLLPQYILAADRGP